MVLFTEKHRETLPRCEGGMEVGIYRLESGKLRHFRCTSGRYDVYIVSAPNMAKLSFIRFGTPVQRLLCFTCLFTLAHSSRISCIQSGFPSPVIADRLRRSRADLESDPQRVDTSAQDHDGSSSSEEVTLRPRAGAGDGRTHCGGSRHGNASDP